MNSLPGLRAIHALRQCGLPEDASYVQLAETITLFEAALELDASLPPNQCAIPGASRACLEAELVKIKSLFCLSASAAGDVAASVAGAKAAAAVATAAVGGKGGRSKAGTIKPGAASGSARISKLQQSWAGFWCAGDLVFASFSK